jgi:lysophospholipase L1-like esterase
MVSRPLKVFFGFVSAVFFTAASIFCAQGAEELTAEQRARLVKAMPKTFPKLEQMAPVHVIVLGDGVSKYFLPGQAKESEFWLKSYHCEFLRRLADRFYYTGGVRDIKPRRGKPDNLFPSVGPEITVQNFSRNGAVLMQALQWLTTDGLDNAPDLAIINYGINDGAMSVGSVRYTQLLDRCIRTCRQAGTEVLVLGASAVSDDSEPRISLGRARPYVLAARRVAEVHGAGFVDLGDATVFADRKKPVNAPTAFRDAVRKVELTHFSHDPPASDRKHPSASGHRRLGAWLVSAVVDGPPPRVYQLGAYFSYPEMGSNRAGLKLLLANDSDDEKSGVLCPLGFGGDWECAQPDIPFSLAPGAKTELTLVYASGGKAPQGGRIDTFRGVVPLSFLIVDGQEQRLYDVEAMSYPVGIDWPRQGLIEVSGEFSLSATVRNNTKSNTKGRYRAEWNGQTLDGEILVSANEKKALALQFRVPDAKSMRVKKPFNIDVTLGGKTYRYQRTMEASRAIALGQSVPLISRAEYSPAMTGTGAGTNAVVSSISATERSLLVQVDVDGVPIEDGADAARLDFTIDARPSKSRDEPGYAGTVTATYSSAGGPAEIKKLSQAAFGEGYDRDLDMAYMKGSSSQASGSGQRFTLEIPRAYLYNHEWNMGSKSSSLGVNVVFSLRRTDPATQLPVYSAKATYLLVESGIHRDDSDGLAILELASRPSGRWTIRIY